MSASVGRVDLDLGINQKGLKQQIKGIGNANKKEFQALGKSLGSSLGHTFSVAIGNMMANLAQTAIQSLGGFFKSSIELGSSIAELENVTSTVFPNMTSQLENFSKSAIQQYGLTEMQAKKMLGTFGAMAQSFNYSEAAAYGMSESLTGLVGDVASFYNLDHDVAYTKIKSVFTGETESLKELGIVMTQTALDEFALQQGMGKTVQQMTEQEKVALRLAFVTDKLNFAAGDFNKTQHQWANQTRILAGQWDSFKSIIGQGFIAALTPIIQKINSLMSVVIKAGEKFREFIATVTGQNVSVSSSGAVMKEISDVTGAAAEAADTASGKASSAAKEVKKSSMGFDKLNKLAEPDKGSGSGSGGSSSGGVPLSSGGTTTVEVTPAVKLDENSFLGKIASYFKSIDFEPLKNSFNGLKEAIMPVLKTVGDSVKWFMEEILAPLGKWVIEDALPAFFNALAGALTFLNPILKSFQSLAEWLWDKFLGPIASWTGGIVVSVLNGIGDALTNIGNWMSDNQSVVDTMVASLATFFGLWKLTQLAAFIQMSGGIAGAFKAITAAIHACTLAKIKDKLETVALTAMYAKDFVVSVAKGTAALVKQAAQWVVLTAAKIKDKIATIAHTVAEGAATAAKWLATAAQTALNVAMTANPIGIIIAAIAALVAGIILLIKNWDTVKEVAVKVWDKIKEIWSKVATWFKEKVIQPIVDFFTGLWDGIVNVFKSIINWVKDNWKSIATFMISPFAGVFKYLWDNFEGFRNFMKKILNGIIRGFEGLINGIIKGLNWMIRALNKISIKIPDWVPEFGGKKFGFNLKEVGLISLPKLAEGGFVRANQPQPVIIGDNKRHGEIVAPEDKLYEIVSRALQAFMGQLIMALNANNSGSQRANEMMQLIIQLGEETIVNRIIKMVNAESRRQGTAVIKI